MKYYNLIRHEFCNLLKWHPVNGDYDRPITMTRNQFILHSREHGHEWWNWQIYEQHIPPEAEMIDELEFIHGQLFRKDFRGNEIICFQQKSIELMEPVIRVAKYNTIKGKVRTVRQYHLPIGNTLDKRIVRKKCEVAAEAIRNGMNVSEALRINHVKWNSLIKYSDYVPKRNVVVNQIVSDVRQKLMKDPSLNLNHLLKESKISSKTFWKKTGGKKSILAYLNYDVSKTLNCIIQS